MGRRLHRMGLVGDDRMEALRQRYGSPDYRAAKGVVRDVFVALMAETYDEDMAAITCPVELVWGADDDQVPVEVAERGRRALPRRHPLGAPGSGPPDPHRGPGRPAAGRPRRTPGRSGARSPVTVLVTPALTLGCQHRGLAWVTVAAGALACVPAGLRWLRVAQREHYLAGSCARFAARWWTVTPLNLVGALVAVAAAVATLVWPVAGVVHRRGGRRRAARAVDPGTHLGAGLDPPAAHPGDGVGRPRGGGGGHRRPGRAGRRPGGGGRAGSSRCWWTWGAPSSPRWSAAWPSGSSTTPSARLARVAPTVVAITGSYGKTSTKNYVAHLVRGTRSVVATPASFNNRAGLARAVNEHLADGTEVFVAEMGTYGPGEIADLCRWCPPTVAVLTAIGPVHLERFGTEERIVEAKAEIAVPATDVVLQVDDPRLAALADRLEGEGKRVWRASAADAATEVAVVPGADGTRATVSVDGAVVAADVPLPTGVQPTNLACALAVALALGVPVEAAAGRLADLPPVAHRLQSVRSPSGFEVLDDTYNSNPAGARAALSALARTGTGGRRVVVTPGMVELGRRQRQENRLLGAEIARAADDLVVVGRTNRRALLAGAASAPAGPTDGRSR